MVESLDKPKRMAGSNPAAATGKSAMKSTEATAAAGTRPGLSTLGAPSGTTTGAEQAVKLVRDGESEEYSEDEFPEEEIE